MAFGVGSQIMVRENKSRPVVDGSPTPPSPAHSTSTPADSACCLPSTVRPASSSATDPTGPCSRECFLLYQASQAGFLTRDLDGWDAHEGVFHESHVLPA
jgi:hypothetical protein